MVPISVRALEGHVLEHVSEAAGALGVVGRAGVDQRVEAEDGGLGALADDERQTVGQDLDRGAFFEAREVLRLRRATRRRSHTERPPQFYFLLAPKLSSRDFSAKNPTIPKRGDGL